MQRNTPDDLDESWLVLLTLDRVAAVLDIPAGTAKSRLAYGLRQLRRAMGAAPK